MNIERACIDCQYEKVWSNSIPCATCFMKDGRPNFKPKQEKTVRTIEDEARELLDRMDIPDADAFTAGDLTEIANLIVDSRELKKLKAAQAPWIGVDPGEQDESVLATIYMGDSSTIRLYSGVRPATPEEPTNVDYSHPLYEAFDDAVKQATKGKGERHGGDKTPFMDQPWHNISKHTGVGGLVFQMVKKAQEACGKDDQEAFERELLGALVYGGAAYLYVKKHGFKK